MIFYTLLKHHTDKLKRSEPLHLRNSYKKREREITKMNNIIDKDITRYHPCLSIKMFEYCSVCNDLISTGTVMFKCVPENSQICLSCYKPEPKKEKIQESEEVEEEVEKTKDNSYIINEVPILITFLYKSYIDYSNLYSIIVKKSILRQYTIENLFLKDEQKNIMIDLYSKAVNNYHSLNKLARIIKFKKVLHYENECDLCLNNLSELSDRIKFDL